MFRHSCAVKVQTERMYPSGKCVRRWQQKGDMTGVWGDRQSKKLKLCILEFQKHQSKKVWLIWFCLWKKSYTTWDVQNPVNNGIFSAEFLPSTVGNIGWRTKWSWNPGYHQEHQPMRIGLWARLLSLFRWAWLVDDMGAPVLWNKTRQTRIISMVVELRGYLKDHVVYVGFVRSCIWWIRHQLWQTPTQATPKQLWQYKNKTQPKVKPFLLPLQSMTSQQLWLQIWNLKACHSISSISSLKRSPLGGLFVFFGTLWVYLVAVLSFFNQHLGPNSPWNPPDNIQLSPWKLIVGRWTFPIISS